MDIVQMRKSKFLPSLQEAVKECDSLRMDPDSPQDITLAQYVKARWGKSMEAFYQDLGLNPAQDTIQNIVNFPDPALRWIMPEIYRDAVRLGMRKSAIYPNLVAATQSVKGMEITQPFINMSDARPEYTGMAETIRLGDVSFGQKTVRLRKIARGIKLPYEVINFVSLNIVSIFLQDYGIKMGQGKDSLALDVLINGDQADGSASAPVIGVAVANTLAYKDLLKVFMRLSRMGKNPTIMVGGEDIAIDTMSLEEFSKRESGTPDKKLNIKTPVPNSTDFYLHSGVPDDQIIILDPSLTLIEYNAQPLLVESEKIASNQTEATYASSISGFGIAYRDARVVLDKSITFASAGFPTYMDPSLLETVTFEKG